MLIPVTLANADVRSVCGS